MTGDSDLAHAVALMRSDTGKRAVAVFPPKRQSYDLEQVVDVSFSLNRTLIMKSRLPDPVVGKGSLPIACPDRWN